MSKKTTRVTIIILSAILLVMIVLIVMAIMQRNDTSQPEPTPRPVEDTPDPKDTVINVIAVSIELESTEIIKGTRFRPEIIILPENATDKLYEIHSDNERILRYIGGNWLAADLGATNLTVTAANGVTATVRITVIPPDLEAIEFQEEEIIMEPDDMIFLNPVLIPADAVPFDPIIYNSSNDRVAIVARDGRLTAIGTGTARITATVGEFSAEVRVRVVVPIKSVVIVMPRRVYAVGDTAQFAIQLDPSNASDEFIEITYSGASVTPTGDTAFRCDEPGEVTITATAENDKTTSLTIYVHDLAAFADEVFRLTNLERHAAGLTQFTRTAPLNQTALVRARETTQLFSHTRPDGRDYITAFDENNVEYLVAGENLAMGQETPAQVLKDWMDSSGHRATILESEFTRMGIGVVMDNNGRLYWVQTFSN